MTDQVYRQDAIKSFQRARQQAKREQFTARLTGREKKLLPFEVIKAELRLLNPMYMGIKEIPLSKVVGSIGRYQEFTRTFLPLNDSLKERWVQIEALAQSSSGWPPIDVYKVSEAYFVKDGNHRTAVARQMGNRTIEAHVWEYPETVEIDTVAELDDILITLGHKSFCERTHIDIIAPDNNIELTRPGRYNEMIAQIENLRQKLIIIDEAPRTFEETVSDWYELIYLPTVQIIRESTLLEDFPGRTETDLFVWLSTHRYRLGDRYGDYKNLADLAQMLTDRYKEKPFQRVGRQVRNLLGGDELPELEDELPELDENLND